MAMTREDKTREARLRRMAKRQGLELVRSRRRDPHALDYDGYMLIDPARQWMVYGFGFNNFGARLPDIEDWLSGDRAEASAA